MVNVNTIGNRLIFAIGFMALLTVGVSGVAVYNWETLDDHIEEIVTINMPTLRSSYQLERNTAGLQAALNQISMNTDPVIHHELQQKITAKLLLINLAIKDTVSMEEYAAILNTQQGLAETLQNYTNELEKRNQQLDTLSQIENNIHWVHQDLINELPLLQQEVEWQLTRMLPNIIDTNAIIDVMTEFSLIQSITVKENELHQLAQEIILQHHNRDLSNAFYFIGYKIAEVQTMSEQLSHYPSTSTYRERLSDLIKVVAPSGPLEQQLKQNAEIYRVIIQHEAEIQQRLAKQEALIQKMVTAADDNLINLNEQTRKAIIISNLFLLGAVCLAIVLTIILSIYLVGRGIVKRLNTLSRDLHEVTKGNLDAEIQVSGKDEIGLIGQNLRQFCHQMKEMERTNALNLINNTQASIITCDLTGQVESVNSSALHLFQHKPTDSEPIVIWQLFNSTIDSRLESLFHDNSPLLENGACNLTLKHFHNQEHLYLRLDFRLFQQGNTDKVIITMTDITEQEKAARWLESIVYEKTESLTNRNRQLREEIEDRKRIEQDLRATQDELIQAAKMAVVGQTMTSLAHELNQPLSAISTHVFATKMAVKKNKLNKLPTNLEKIEGLTSRMGRIIASLRNFSKKQSADNPLSPIAVRDSVEQAMQIVEGRARVQQTQIENAIDPNLLILADDVQFEQVLVNLLVNSCDAVASNEPRHIKVHSLPPNPHTIMIAVSDTGGGFDAVMMKKLFTPFTTTKDVGLGLGLSICRSILTRFGGSISLASNLDQGAMVILELPKHENNQ
ncbi:histidine kinase [Photobacterium jeanii]|uniref:C4-dicarboxylate transport sensor protein DctB n=1 Tax=Photobacterium jeanii TaxID=858640 RepID=A0A178KN84_9GAMM|nr:ATP-binding protein [Photobacterium jeanii]OAN18660.1 histidine kinase [Photobacterium jeanii]PST91660.1 HAMP domain-containing protein [Photobacterium jeanii]